MVTKLHLFQNTFALSLWFIYFLNNYKHSDFNYLNIMLGWKKNLRTVNNIREFQNTAFLE